MGYIRVAEIRKTFGLKGEVLCYSLTSFPKLRFKKGQKFFLNKDGSEERLEVTLHSFRPSDDYVYLGFEELPSIEAVTPYLHFYVEMSEEDAPLPKDYVRLTDLYACKVYDEEGNELGQAKQLLENATTPSLRVGRQGEKDFFVPWLRDVFIKDVDIEHHRIVIHVIPGMLS